MRKLRSDQAASLIVLLAGVFLLGWSWWQPVTVIAQPAKTTSKLELQGVNPIPIATDLLSGRATSSAELETMIAAFTATLSAQAIYVMDVPTASILLTKQADQARFPASTTKLMSALVALDTYEPNQVLTVLTEGETEGGVMGLQAGENIKVEDLLAGLLVSSANDAAMVLANRYPEGYAGFIAAMNAKAAALNLDRTTFTNPAGLDTSGHVSTARDLAILGREIMKHPILQQVVKTEKLTVTDAALAINHPLKNTNELLGIEPGVIGVKTGTTDLAGEVLITQLQRNGREILVVIMGSQNRYFETKQIYNWVFDHYSWQNLDSGTLN